MPSDSYKAISLFSAAAAFGLVLSLWMIGVLIWANARKRRAAQVQDRLDYASAAARHSGSGRVLRLWHEGKSATMFVPGQGSNSLLARLERFRVAAGIESPLSSVIPMFAGILASIVGAGYFLTSSFAVAVMCAIATAIVLWIHYSHKIAKQTRTFERQLIDALEACVAIASGRSSAGRIVPAHFRGNRRTHWRTVRGNLPAAGAWRANGTGAAQRRRAEP